MFCCRSIRGETPVFYRFFLVLLILMLTGCATEANYRKMVLSWHGKNINQLINVWGYPDRTIKAPNGNKVYVYNHRNVYSTPGYSTGGYTSVTTSSEGNSIVVQQPLVEHTPQTYYEHCKTWFEFNHRHIITRITYRGNSCVM